MKNYELLYILPSNMTAVEIKSSFLEIEKEIEKLGAKKLVTLLEHPFLSKTEMSKEEGSEDLKTIPVIKKKLAYPIKKNRFGFYCLFNFSAEEKSLKEIEYYLKMSKIVIRHIILQADSMNEEQLKLLHKLFARKKSEQDKEADKEKLDKEEKRAKKDMRAKEKIPAKIEEKQIEEVKEKEVKKEKEADEEKTEIKEEKVKKVIEEKKVKKVEASKAKEVKEVEVEKKVEKKEEKEEKEKKEKKTEKEKKKDTKSASKKKSKVKLEDLEDKLDEILEDTMI